MADDRTTGTALGPMVIAAMDQHEPHPLVHDELAARILPVGAQAMVWLARWAPVRQWIFRVSERKIPGLWASMLCRKRYIDDPCFEAVADGVQAAARQAAGDRANLRSVLAELHTATAEGLCGITVPSGPA